MGPRREFVRLQGLPVNQRGESGSRQGPNIRERRRSQGSDSYWLHERSQFLRNSRRSQPHVQVPSRCIAIEGRGVGSQRGLERRLRCGQPFGARAAGTRGRVREAHTLLHLEQVRRVRAALRSGTEEIVARAEAVEAS